MWETLKQEISAYNLAKKLKSVCKSNVKIKLVSYPSKYPEDEPRRRCPSIKKFIKEFKFQPKISLSNGIKNTFENFYLKVNLICMRRYHVFHLALEKILGYQ